MGDKPLQRLDDEQVDGVAGGYLYCTRQKGDERPWQVLDDKGNVVECFDSYYTAFDWAGKNGYNCMPLGPDEVETLRTKGWPW